MPLENFHKNNRAKDGLRSWCKECMSLSNKKYYESRKNEVIIKDKPKVEDKCVKELDEVGLQKIPARLLISELRRRGYRGELELVTIQKVVI